MPRAFTQSEKQTIKDQLLESGRELFSAHGLKKTSIEELATAAGVSKAGFYLFYESKEALFMDVVEREEQHFRRQVLMVLDQPGSTPRARLAAMFRRAFTLWKTIPVLRFFTGSEYAALARRIPPETIREHLDSDRAFVEELIARCRAAGIPVQVQPEALGGLLYALFFTVLHSDDLGPQRLAPAIDTLIELTAAFCLGEVEIESAGSGNLSPLQPGGAYDSGN